MRIYLNEGKLNLMRKAFSEPGEAMESKMLTKVIASAQAKVEAHNFDGRKICLSLMMLLTINATLFMHSVMNCWKMMIYPKRLM